MQKLFQSRKLTSKLCATKLNICADFGVLRKVNRSKWAALTYLVKKKNVNAEGITKACFISDFCQLNACIKRTPYPIPKIQDMLQQLKGFTYASAIDLNMGCYHIKLNAESPKLCTIVLPWGKYEYTSLPMGLSNSPDVFQEKMNELFQQQHHGDKCAAFTPKEAMHAMLLDLDLLLAAMMRLPATLFPLVPFP